MSRRLSIRVPSKSKAISRIISCERIASVRGIPRITISRVIDVAVLCSAGLDSAVLVAHLAQTGRVLPLYVSVGFAWEAAERARLAQLAATEAFAENVLPP